MEVLSIIAKVFLVLASLVLIATVLLQPGEKQGLGVIAGGAETFFGKNKARSIEGKLALATKVSAGVFIVMALLIAALPRG
ncbi:MAG: preprotein translocase subunit SecG [Oscillospiraceae bacterium]|jgi:preprotein translocase subunit SecG|nr:preprotein translocase subunit SecG [Oscillospiraceae bacterium]